ncbi:hypothetical protein DFP73DRAFT_611029 [Morchella snyderi]|nr:hypothetical protein DFP73DRAFT_611029 [Morchella snyderi]
MKSALLRRMDMTNTSSAAIEAAQILDPWTGQWKYPRALIIFLCAIVAIFTLLHISQFLRDRRRLSSKSRKATLSLYDHSAAVLRSLIYRRPLHSAPALGPMILIVSLLVFTLVWTFTVQPYYRPLRSGGSPPLSLRSGLFAVGLTPIIYLLAFKANIVTYLTGVSHEKLNVLHRWGARLVLLLGVVHTIPFLVQPLREGGHAELKRVWAEDNINVTGCAALAAKYCYELFVGTHILSAVLYLAFMFWHCEDLLTSWTYLWTTAALWLASVLLRFMNTTFHAALPCTLRLLPGDAVMVTIPTTHIWTPAQHVFLRFPGLSVFDNHPFSVCSVSKISDELNTLVVVVKPCSGFTRRLFLAAAEDGPEAAMQVVVDGPYGGVPRVVESFQGVVLVAGGSGVTAVVGVLSWLVRCMRKGEGCVEKIKLVWVVKDRRALAWFGGEVAEAVAVTGVECRFYVTGQEEESEKMEAMDGVEIAKGRPNCGQMLEEWVGEMGERVCVVASGPRGLRSDVANSVAGLQRKVNDRESGLQELYLHTEAFDW